MISKASKAMTNNQNPIDDNSITTETTSGDILANIAGPDILDSFRNTESHASLGTEAKGLRNMEANLRRIAIDRDLDQPDMAAAKTFQAQSDQDIVSAFRKESEKKSEM